jgi:hypothetical protein
MLLLIPQFLRPRGWVIVGCEPIGKSHAFLAQSPSSITRPDPNDGLRRLERAPISGSNLEDGKSFSEGVLTVLSSKVAKSFD